MNIYKRSRLTSPLSIEDVRVLLNQKSHATLSRVEVGKQIPSLEIAIGYHVLFKTPLVELLQSEIDRCKLYLESYSKFRRDQLLERGNMMIHADKLVFLEQFEDEEN
jgi:DNA-binding XRE family transcriptional regulator